MTKQNALYFSLILLLICTLNALQAQEETPLAIRRGDVAVFGAIGRADFYRSPKDRFKPFGPLHQNAWMAGISLRTGKKLYELRLDAYFAQQGGKERFETFTDGLVESDVSLSYLGLRLQPLNLRYQKERFYVHTGLGGYGSVLLQSEIKVNDKIFEETPLQELSPFDFGLVLSAGVGYGKFNLVLHYQVGYQAIEETESTARNQLLTLGLNIWL
ncbi:MAG: hypothetical protein Sapg2KO_44690 [Saprospiraceae bacterium]